MKDDIVSGAMTAGHAKAILSLVNPSDRQLLRDKIIREGLSVRDAEEMATSFNKGQKVKTKKKNEKEDEEIKKTEEKFTSTLGSKCEIKGSLDKGKLIIKFRSSSDLEKLYALISKGEILFDD